MQLKQLAMFAATGLTLPGVAAAAAETPADVNKQVLELLRNVQFVTEIIFDKKKDQLEYASMRLAKEADQAGKIATAVGAGSKWSGGDRGKACKNLVTNSGHLRTAFDDFGYAHKRENFAVGSEDKIIEPLSDLNEAFAMVGAAILARADHCPYKEPQYAGVAALEELGVRFDATADEYAAKN